MFQACLMISKMSSSSQRNDCSVWAELKLKEQLSPLSEFSKDVKMLTVALFTERVRCWEYSWDYKLFIYFVLHEEFFYFEGRIVELAVASSTMRSSKP